MTTDYGSQFYCRLCVEINDFENSLFAEKYPNVITHNAFFESSQIQVMIPIGPLRMGHLLIASKNHAWSFGHISKQVILELNEVINSVSEFLRNYCDANRVIVFEHGALSTTQSGGSCLNHAHMNIMPIPATFPLFEMASRYIEFVPTELHQVGAYPERGEPYLFFQCSREGSFAAAAPIGSTQFFRKLLASGTPECHWDWRVDPRTDLVVSMAALLRDCRGEPIYDRSV